MSELTTRILTALEGGAPEAAERLWGPINGPGSAQSVLAGDRANARGPVCESAAPLLHCCLEAMRRILVDSARRTHAVRHAAGFSAAYEKLEDARRM
jgi:hypothetical protein